MKVYIVGFIYIGGVGSNMKMEGVHGERRSASL